MTLILPSMGAFGHTVSGGEAESLTTSDNFYAGTLNTSLWTTTNTPTGTSRSFGNDGTDWWIELATTDSNSHDHYNSSGLPTVPYILQPNSNTDFDIRAKFLTTPGAQYEGMGFIVYGDATHYVRFDFNRTSGGNYFGFASLVDGGSPLGRINVSFSTTWYPYIRVTRSGNTFSLYRSSDGSSWTQVGSSFVHSMTVAAIGIATNSSSSSTGFAGRFDWFEDFSNDPISNEN